MRVTRKLESEASFVAQLRPAKPLPTITTCFCAAPVLAVLFIYLPPPLVGHVVDATPVFRHRAKTQEQYIAGFMQHFGSRLLTQATDVYYDSPPRGRRSDAALSDRRERNHKPAL